MAVMNLIFVVQGEPKAQPRAKACSRGGFVRMYTPTTAKAWKALVTAGAQSADGFPKTPCLAPIACSMSFFMARPKRLLRKKDPEEPLPCPKKPDLDNLVKAVYDALTTAGVWKDDAQVVRSDACKMYCAKGDEPEAIIQVSEFCDES